MSTTVSTSSPAPTDATPHPRAMLAFGGIWRLTYPRFMTSGSVIATVGLLLALALLSIPVLQSSGTENYHGWWVPFYFTLLLPTLSFLSGAGALRDEMKATAVDYIQTRPIRRPVLVVFKFLTHFACVQVSYLLALAVVIGAGVYRGIPGALTEAPLLFAAQLVGSAVFMALGFFFAALTSRYLALGIVYGAAVEAGIGRIPTQLSRLSLTRHIETIVLPEHGGLAATLSGQPSAGDSFVVLLVVAVVLLASTAWIFDRKEFAGSRPKDA